MAGLLDFIQTPAGMGLLSAVAGGLAGARKGTPWNNFGRAGMAGLAGYATANDQLTQDELRKDQKAMQDLQRQLITAQVGKMQQDTSAQQALQEAFKPRMFGQNQAVQANLGDYQKMIEQGAQESGMDIPAYLQANPEFANTGVQYGVDPEAVRSAAMQTEEGRKAIIGSMFKEPEKPQLVTVYDENGNATQQWMRPGEQQGVSIGGAKPEKRGQIDVPRQDGTWQMYQEKPDGTPDLTKPIGSPFKKRATASETNASVGAITLSTEKKYGEKFAEKVADSDIGLRDAANSAPALAERSNRIKQVLSSGKVITGFGADARLQLGKALGLVGASDKETIANTEALSADLARNTLDAIKASGLGSGSGFSNADRDFLNKAAGGLISFDSASIARLADLSHRAAQQSAEKWNKRAREIPDTALQGTGITRDPVQVPPLFGQKEQQPIQVPQGAVDYLRRNVKINPALKADFDKKYGQGAADKYLKGK